MGTIWEAADGATVSRLAATKRPDLIIVDWEMPMIDGPQFVQMIRTSDEFPVPDTPIIVLSAHSDQWRVIESARIGANEFVRKPVSIKTLERPNRGDPQRPRPASNTRLSPVAAPAGSIATSDSDQAAVAPAAPDVACSRSMRGRSLCSFFFHWPRAALRLRAYLRRHPAAAQPAANWPQHTVRLITPLGPGSGMDVAARLFAERLSQKWRQPVVVENRQGADGILAVQSFLGDRDNHSLIFGFGGLISINPLIHGDKLPYNVADVVPVASALDSTLALIASRRSASIHCKTS